MLELSKCTVLVVDDTEANIDSLVAPLIANMKSALQWMVKMPWKPLTQNHQTLVFNAQ